MSTGESCPKCAAATISKRSAEPWCPACEWNLDWFDAGQRQPELGWRWVDRRLFRTAYWLTERQFAELKGAPPAVRSASAARIVTVAVSVLLLAAVAALFGTGVWLLLHDFFSPINLIGALMIAIAVFLRPRLGSLDKDAVELDRTIAPTLFAVIDRVAATVGAPVPDVVLFDGAYNAYTARVGLSRRRVLCLGAQLWAVLDGQERVALLGHELGHFVNGDVRRGLVTQAARTTLAKVSYILTPERGAGVVEMIVGLLSRIASQIFLWLHLLLLWTSMRDSQRAEYRADELAARAGGSDAAIRMVDGLLLYDAIDTVVGREARAGNGAAAWRAAVEQARGRLAGDMPALRQLSRRTGASLFASHPPDGLRADLIAARAAQPAAVVVTEVERDRMDDELATHYERARRDLATANW